MLKVFSLLNRRSKTKVTLLKYTNSLTLLERRMASIASRQAVTATPHYLIIDRTRFQIVVGPIEIPPVSSYGMHCRLSERAHLQKVRAAPRTYDDSVQGKLYTKSIEPSWRGEASGTQRTFMLRLLRKDTALTKLTKSTSVALPPFQTVLSDGDLKSRKVEIATAMLAGRNVPGNLPPICAALLNRAYHSAVRPAL